MIGLNLELLRSRFDDFRLYSTFAQRKRVIIFDNYLKNKLLILWASPVYFAQWACKIAICMMIDKSE